MWEMLQMGDDFLRTGKWMREAQRCEERKDEGEEWCNVIRGRVNGTTLGNDG